MNHASKSPKIILYTVRHYHAKRQVFQLKVDQYKLLTSATASSEATKLRAARLAREAVDYDKQWSKYLHYVPAI